MALEAITPLPLPPRICDELGRLARGPRLGRVEVACSGPPVGSRMSAPLPRSCAPLAYLSSYSHRGKYYTLNEIARFDQLGLWSPPPSSLLPPPHPDQHLCRSGRRLRSRLLSRRTRAPAARPGQGPAAQADSPGSHPALQGRRRSWVHFSADSKHYHAQLRARHIAESASTAPSLSSVGPVVPDELRAAIILFYSLLDERQRRLYAALESLKIGHGGDRRIAELLGLDAGTVARGRQQLLAGDVHRQRVRRPGGGRHPVEKKRPR